MRRPQRLDLLPHAAITSYEVAAEVAVIQIRDTPPLRLTGPGAWSHSVLVAHALHGPGRWHTAPWVEPIHHAANYTMAAQSHI